MVVLDTNVISAVVTRQDHILDWINRDHSINFATTVITVFELEFGLERLPLGRRRNHLADRIGTALAPFQDRILQLEREAATLAGRFRAERERVGRPIGISDALIAGIAAHAGARLATRNVRDFAGLPLDVVDPWADAAPG
jgi:hypothetical protein